MILSLNSFDIFYKVYLKRFSSNQTHFYDFEIDSYGNWFDKEPKDIHFTIGIMPFQSENVKIVVKKRFFLLVEIFKEYQFPEEEGWSKNKELIPSELKKKLEGKELDDFEFIILYENKLIIASIDGFGPILDLFKKLKSST